jgi:hypothetical protein
MDYWWWLGELVNYVHVMLIGGFVLGGILWVRPIWLWFAALVAMVVSWPLLFHNQCPITMLSNWLQSTTWFSFLSNFAPTYGALPGTLIVLSLLAASFVLSYWFRQPPEVGLPERWKRQMLGNTRVDKL